MNDLLWLLDLQVKQVVLDCNRDGLLCASKSGVASGGSVEASVRLRFIRGQTVRRKGKGDERKLAHHF